MALQVIGGEWGGRRLKSPPGTVRPTLAILRRALYDTLGPGIAGKHVLDLYAGSGSLGLEALSRGAARADFVERDPRTAAIARQNLAALTGSEAGPRGRVHCGAVSRWVAGNGELMRGYQLVILDPPYGDAGLPAILAALGNKGALEQGAMVVVERRADEEHPTVPGLTEVRRIRHGGSMMVMSRALE